MGMVVESRAGFVFLPYVYYEYGIAIGVVVWKIRSCIRNCCFFIVRRLFWDTSLCIVLASTGDSESVCTYRRTSRIYC